MKKILAFVVAIVLCLSCFAACGKKTETPAGTGSTPTQVVYDVEDAAAYLKNMYKKYLTETETAADFTLVSQVMKGDVVYKVEWTVDNEGIKVLADEANKQVKIDLDEKTKVDVNYKLTATVKDPDGKTATLTFELKVPKYVLSSWKDYMAAEAGKAVVVEGYVVAVHSQQEGNKYNQLYLQDVNGDGGYYIYSIANSVDPVKDLGIKMGMLVSVTGTKDIYSGTHELKDAVVNVLDTNVVDLKPLDLTNAYKNATSLKDDALISKLGMLVTIKGVEITDQDLSEKSMYMNFKLAGLTSYIRVYATDCPASVSDAGQQKIITDHAAKKGYEATVTGVVVQYSGAIYLNPVSDKPFTYGKKIERTPEQMVQVEMDEVKFEKDITLNKEIELPTKGNTYEDVVITWTSNSEAIVIEDGVAKITLQAEATTASITGTFTLGTITKTKTITFNLAKKSAVVTQTVTAPVVGQAYKLFTIQENLGGFYYFTGAYSDDRNQYGKSSNNVNDAIDVVLEAAEGNKYYLTMGTGANKKYITIVASVGTDSKTGAEKTYTNFNITSTKPATAFTFDTTYNTLVMSVVDPLTDKAADYYMGTYGTYDTFSASVISYAATSFPSHLGTVVDSSKISDTDKVATEKEGLSIESDEFFTDAEINLDVKGSIYDDVTITWSSNNAAAVVNGGGKLVITQGAADVTAKITATLTCGTATATKEFNITIAKIVTMPYETGKEYLFGMVHGNLENKTLYFKGEMHSNGYQFTSTEDAASAAKVILEEDGTGYQIYFMNGNAKTYITIVPSGNYNNPAFVTTKPTTPWNYDSSLGTFTIVSGTKSFFLGTRNDRTENAFSACETKYTSNFKAVLMPTTPAPYKLNTEYVMQMVQGKANKTVYLTGKMSSYYLATSETLSDAIKVIAELDGEGYQLYYMDGTTKTYLTMVMNDTHCNGAYVTEKPLTVWKWDATLNALTMTVSNGKTYFLGTRNDQSYTTVGPCESKYTENFKALLVDPATLGGSDTGDDSGEGNTGGSTGGNTTAPTGQKYRFSATKDGTKYYLTSTINSGKGTITTDASSAATFYVEKNGEFYNIYWWDGSARQYLSFKDAGSTSDLQWSTTAFDLQAVEVEGVTVYQHPTTLRALSLYQTQDMRTYKTNTANNFNGTNGVAVALEAIA